MKRFLSTLCAGALMAATAAMGLSPAVAMPSGFTPNSPSANVIQVQGTDGVGGGIPSARYWDRVGGGQQWGGPRYRPDRGWRNGPRADREWRHAPRRGYHHDGRYGWYNGHRGYRSYRRGYREYNGFWFPLAAFAAGAVISGAINNSAPVYRGTSNSHVQWCYNRYRSYRASDNTFQPYHGPRQQCYSPYS